SCVEEARSVWHEELHDVAEFGNFDRGADKILCQTRSPVPDEDLQSALAKGSRDSGPDNSESDQTDVFAFGACHDQRPHSFKRRRAQGEFDSAGPQWQLRYCFLLCCVSAPSLLVDSVELGRRMLLSR